MKSLNIHRQNIKLRLHKPSSVNTSNYLSEKKYRENYQINTWTKRRANHLLRNDRDSSDVGMSKRASAIQI